MDIYKENSNIHYLYDHYTFSKLNCIMCGKVTNFAQLFFVKIVYTKNNKMIYSGHEMLQREAKDKQ